MSTDPNEILREGIYDGNFPNVDRNNGGRIWPFKNYHTDGLSGTKVDDTDLGALYPHAKRGRKWEQAGCCNQCQVCPCCCAMPMDDCIHPSNLTGTFSVAIQVKATGNELIQLAIDDLNKHANRSGTITYKSNGGKEYHQSTNTYGDPCQYQGNFIEHSDDYVPNPWSPFDPNPNFTIYAAPGINSWAQTDSRCGWSFQNFSFSASGKYEAGNGTWRASIGYSFSGHDVRTAVRVDDCEDRHASVSFTTSGQLVSINNSYIGYSTTMYATITVTLGISWELGPDVIMTPATLQARLTSGVIPCAKSKRGTKDIIQVAIDTAVNMGNVTLAYYSSCGYKSELHPISPKHPGWYIQYTAGVNQSTAFPWMSSYVAGIKCSAKWSASCNLVNVWTKQSLADPNNPRGGYSINCLETETWVLASGSIDSSFEGEYTCLKMPTGIPNNNADPTCCECEDGPPCTGRSCCYRVHHSAGINGGIAFGDINV